MTMKWLLWVALLVEPISGFAGVQHSPRQRTTHLQQGVNPETVDEASTITRRSLLGSVAGAASLTLLSSASTYPANAAVGSLPELQDTNVVLQGITVKVSDPLQQKQMLTFLQDAFDMVVLRGTPDGADTWLGYGPEQLKVPKDFMLPVSAFGKYGGHASVRVQYDAQATSAYYRGEGNAPGDNIAYLQVGVPQYRVSQMVKNGANVLDAYGFINVVSPCGLPMRGIVGIWPDPMMFCAINCKSVQESKEFYQELGFAEQEYPYCRPLKGLGQFEPPQPKGSLYMAPSPNSMGVLLLPTSNKRKQITSNPAVQGLNLIYSPSEGSDQADDLTRLVDPSGVGIGFEAFSKFEATEKSTRVAPPT